MEKEIKIKINLEQEIEKYLIANAKLLIEGDSKLVVHHIAEHFFKLGIQQVQKEINYEKTKKD